MEMAVMCKRGITKEDLNELGMEIKKCVEDRELKAKEIKKYILKNTEFMMDTNGQGDTGYAIANKATFVFTKALGGADQVAVFTLPYQVDLILDPIIDYDAIMNIFKSEGTCSVEYDSNHHDSLIKVNSIIDSSNIALSPLSTEYLGLGLFLFNKIALMNMAGTYFSEYMNKNDIKFKISELADDYILLKSSNRDFMRMYNDNKDVSIKLTYIGEFDIKLEFIEGDEVKDVYMYEPHKLVPSEIYNQIPKHSDYIIKFIEI